jgi:hypothetical protein
MNFHVNGNLEAGVHNVTMELFHGTFVASFPHSSTRARIYEGFVKYLSELFSTKPNYEPLVDGSYVTKKNDPSDIDCLIVADAAAVDALTDEDKQKLSSLFIHPDCKRKYCCDAYFLAAVPEGHPGYDHYRAMRKYWLGEFGYDRQEQPKGIVRIEGIR